jgi:hypothetical protein
MSATPHDCVVSKLVAGRQKDREFAAALIRAGIVDPRTLVARVAMLPKRVGDARRDELVAWIQRHRGSRGGFE